MKARDKSRASAGQVSRKCTPSMPAHGVILGLSPKVLASAEPAGIQGLADPDTGQAILQVDQGAPGNKSGPPAKRPDQR